MESLSIKSPTQLLLQTGSKTVFGPTQRLSNLDVIIKKGVFWGRHIYTLKKTNFKCLNTLHIFYSCTHSFGGIVLPPLVK